ncbi:uncharacterized protein LOC108865189 [Galendromus occidentalis]|uniref:Uncharacterized protein LOC108865189 n=1 Tax=Galendromus occidentalis TaxID=34638 RepID=A0AAJ7SHW2_9ACAR|nr:uncharacterized protein LOC108865189 [Galendromus occidentalis]
MEQVTGSVSYGNLMNTLQTAIAHNTKLIHLNTNKKMLVPEISRLTSNRPICVSDVLYRVFTRILGKHIQQWAEDTEQLSEMQNGFRKDRRGEDNIFILTSAIEIARAQKTGLICVFLDATKAYDRIDRRKLWQTLEERGMSPSIIELLKHLYEETFIFVRHGEYTSEEVSIPIGLRQGCPLSPILFSLYIADLGKQLLETGLGFRFAKKSNFWDVKENKFFTIPGLLFADDLCLMANKIGDMRALLEITSKFGDNRPIKFNPQKSGVIVFSRPPSTHMHDQGLTIQGRQIPEVESYKYLGIELSAERYYLSQHWEKVTWTANKAIQRLNARTLWSFNRFEVSKILWKATAVPQLTYCNATITMPKRLRNLIEVRQRDAGRWALGIPHSTISKEFIEGELGWSSFEAREATSKTMYFESVKHMDQKRWPRRILTAIELTKARNMVTKTTLRIYRQFKDKRGLERNIYDNRRGSRLLALARAGMLNTRSRQHARDPSIDESCPKCGAPETDTHIVLECEEGRFDHKNIRTDLDFTLVQPRMI